MSRTGVVLAVAVIALVYIVNNYLVDNGSGDDDASATAAKVSADTATGATATPGTTTKPKLSLERAQEVIRERAQALMAKLSPGQVQELKAKLSREQLQELKRDADTEVYLSREHAEELTRVANDWASQFVTNGCNRYMGQPVCERLPNRMSAAFKKSFADATVEDIKSERIMLVGWADRPYYLAAVKFSNGEMVVFGGVPGPEPPDGSCAGAGSGCVWNIAEPDENRGFLEAARE